MIVKRVEWSWAGTRLDFYSQIRATHTFQWLQLSISRLQSSVPESHPNQLRRLIYFSRIFLWSGLSELKTQAVADGSSPNLKLIPVKICCFVTTLQGKKRKISLKCYNTIFREWGGDEKIGSKYPAVKYFHQIFIKSLIFMVVKQWIYNITCKCNEMLSVSIW